MFKLMLLDIGTGAKIDGRVIRDVFTREIRTFGDVKPEIIEMKF